MPTYQYACTACEHRFEAVQAFTDAAMSECPECDGRLRKLYGSVGVVFKGSGFYRNDSRSGTKDTASTPAKTESAPAAKTETSSSSTTTTTSTTTSTATPAAKAS
ncbi:Putative regulatory protein, FmdB family [Alloactinosynnema sp. L-07]|uniref:FmdB family zinc ribbon protein n=1 Tax=Alloactinosynnema sp. L-07 TaxID=1653480 RepID=UPI00065EFFE0|nr:FmdB family zinc ribbon protein [Alloactinosynnema sp. L-07]CRK61437.1 Putative regulatory protein, FmdB family [Alloactinosynnema sp. L-07]